MMNRNRIYHGLFGRVVLLDMCHPLVTHAHPQPHIIVKIGGADGAMEVYGRNLPLTSETVVLINAWEPHSYVGSRGGPAFLLAFFLDPAWLSDLRSPHRELCFDQHCVPRTPELKRLFSPFVGHMLHDFAVEQQILERLVGEITVRATSLSEHNSVARAADFRIRRTIHYIRENPAHHFDTAELAAISGLSVPHFFERFQGMHRRHARHLCQGRKDGARLQRPDVRRMPHRQSVRQPRFQGTEPFHPLLSRAHRHHAELLQASVPRP